MQQGINIDADILRGDAGGEDYLVVKYLLSAYTNEVNFEIRRLARGIHSVYCNFFISLI